MLERRQEALRIQKGKSKALNTEKIAKSNETVKEKASRIREEREKRLEEEMKRR